MLDLDTRVAILRLHREGHGTRAIAKMVGVSRNAVKRVLRSGQAEAQGLERAWSLDAHLDVVRALHEECAGNLVRVVEELAARKQFEVGYSTLTAFCRKHGIGHKPKERVGEYHFRPGEEMQHDTSPHEVKVQGTSMLLQCASVVLCFSRLLFAQVYLRFSRFECRVFLTEAIKYFGGAASRCMIDNTSVIIAHGTGPDAVPAAQMEAFGKRFGTAFVAHAVGDANRSARVERPFHYIENNFYPGRCFQTLEDLNVQLRGWCDRVNHKPKKRLGASPRQLFAVEQSTLSSLPKYIPEIYDLHSRRVDTEGYVGVHTNRYSAPTDLIGRQVEVRESIETIRIFDGRRLVTEHAREQPGLNLRKTLQEHKGQRRFKTKPAPLPEEKTLRAQHEILDRLVDRLKKRYGGRAVRSIRRLHRIFVDYPTDAVVKAVSLALEHGLIDLGRIEKMVLTNIAGDYFRLPDPKDESGGQDE